MFKKWFLLLLAILMIFSLAACNKQDPTPPSNDDPTPNKPTPSTPKAEPTLVDSGALQNGAITWELYTDDSMTGTLYLKGSGALEDLESAEDQPWWIYGDDRIYGDRNLMENDIVLITAIVVEEGITKLGENTLAEQESVTSITLPSTLTVLSNACLKDCKNLRTVSGGTGITLIEANALRYCTVLESIELSSKLTEVGESAFGGLQRALSVRFHGTEAQWSAITVALGNEKLTSATVLYPTE